MSTLLLRRIRRFRLPAVAATLLLCATLATAAPAPMPPAPTAPAARVAVRQPHGSVQQEPGWYPASDPESSSVRIGRRLHAPLVRKRLAGGARSLDELGRRVCHALAYGRSDSLLALCVREDEFRDIMWREFPQSRPATGVTWGDAWTFLGARLHGGSVSAAKDWGGHRYQFLRWERYDTTAVYRNFKLHNGLILYARNQDDGGVERFTWLRSVVERGGAFKIYSMKD